MTEIDHVKIHPAIGIARVGNGEQFFHGPESPDEKPLAPGSYKEGTGKIKRQAARFRVYGYDKDGKVVREILHGQGGASVEWAVQLANHKAAWYKFSLALDIPEAQRLSQDQYGQRNAGTDRGQLRIDPGSRKISGTNQSGQKFDTGKINGKAVYLGELQTDEKGRLRVLGGRGSSASFTTTPTPLTTFGNNEGWHDDISDGPVTATVRIDGKEVAVQPAWVVVGPPNYAPDVKGIVTLYDLLYDLFVQGGYLPAPSTVVFDEHIKPLLQRFTGHQWVNQGFAAEFGWQGPNDFTSPQLLAILGNKKDQYRELRQRVYYQMRSYDRDGLSPLPWPWLYGDAMAVPAQSPRQYGVLTTTQEQMLEQWVKGDFDDKTKYTSYPSLDDAPVALQPGLLDRAALDYCLADAFHPGCEVTWPIRHDTLYAEPFRILHRPAGTAERDYGPHLTPQLALSGNGPLHGQGPGGLTRWMGVPWQTDTASCRSGYELRANIGPRYSPYLPSFWPARVPNHVLKKTDFDKVNQKPNTTVTEDERAQAFENRAVWLRFLSPDKQTGLQNMVDNWSKFGVIETNAYTVADGKFPAAILVESTPDPSLPQVKDRQNLVNVHVRETGQPQLAESQRTAVNEQAANEIALTTGFQPEEISAGYIAKVDPFRDV
ncbi:LodA/GoxA family CTQ-dependent oxidase [Kitasatospora sp. NPDC059811]|uniref:LodA/GoxA family CTQ-dependent oxidase n=1 Tax=Streptomycetaceae TaxID=2062 RepID=UPI0007AFA78D|nr:LodA/GoxA family CTQ-dependent oxidase [Streptomyces sp. MJM8645]